MCERQFEEGGAPQPFRNPVRGCGNGGYRGERVNLCRTSGAMIIQTSNRGDI